MRDANDDPAHLERLAEKMRDKKKPPFSVGSYGLIFSDLIAIPGKQLIF